MINHLCDQLASLGTENHYAHTIRIFLYALYAWVIANQLLLFPEHHFFWSPESILPLRPDTIPQGALKAFYLLQYDSVRPYYVFFIVGAILSGLISIARIAWRSPRILTLFFALNLNNGSFLLLNGGDNLISLLLIYACFFEPRVNIPTRYLGATGSRILLALSNTAMLVGRVQVCFVYLVAGLTKITGTSWQNGTALFYTLNVEEYTLPAMSTFMTENAYLSVFASYGTLLFQLSFPWLVWFHQTRPFVLLTGTLLHLQISFIMGLLMFGFAMMVSYILFSPEERSQSLGAGVRRIMALGALFRGRVIHYASR